MSTAKIRALIDDVSEEYGEGAVREALAEVEAIEKAAQFLASASQDVEACVEAMRTFTTIAAQRKAGTAGATGPSVAGASGPQE